ncbi:DUF1310 family protein [Streptococcus caprae]|uniref:DUF1310 family protein n=1 Tax=Streptococcus caprae TaxID=1640501 RepID=A0ABV8CVS6_9STRE
MKKSVKMLVALVIIIVVGIGGFAMHQHKEKEKMIAIATSKEAKKVYEEHLKKQDSNAFSETGFVQSYEVDQNSLEYNPMGGLMVSLVINNDKNMIVDFNLIDNGDGTYSSAYYGSSPKFWKTRDSYKQELVDE